MKERNHKYIAALVIEAQRGNSDAFAELYGITYNATLFYTKRYLKDEQAAQDALQEIYILALKNLGKLKDPSLFIAWLKQISFHVCFDMCKKTQTDYGSVTDPELLSVITDERTDRNPSAYLLEQDLAETLQQACFSLPANEKQAIILRYYNNMKIDDVAAIMDISKSTAKRYLASGISGIKNYFANRRLTL